MIQILGYIFLASLISCGLFVGDYYTYGNFLNDFIDNHFIETFGAFVGLNITAVIFLLGQLISVKEKFEKNGVAFKATIEEIKDNTYFQIGCFVLSIIFLTFRPDINKTDHSLSLNIGYYVVNHIVIVFFVLALTSIIEIIRATFRVHKLV